MIVRRLLILIMVFIVVLTGTIYIWLSTYEEWSHPVKPEKVPEAAIWAGGYDGGCFILLPTELTDTSRFTIYNEYTGDVWYNGFFYCDYNDFKRVSRADRQEFLCYNGVNIFMRDPDDKNREIIWHKVMPENVQDNDVFWVECNGIGWFFLLRGVYSDTSHFVIYDDITGDILHDGLFCCEKSDFERIVETEWTNLIENYDGAKIIMKDPNDKQRKIIWHSINNSHIKN